MQQIDHVINELLRFRETLIALRSSDDSVHEQFFADATACGFYYHCGEVHREANAMARRADGLFMLPF